MIYLPKNVSFLVWIFLIPLLVLGVETAYAEICPCPTSEEVRALFRSENIMWVDLTVDPAKFMLNNPYIGYFSPTPIRWATYKYGDLESYRNVNLVSRYEAPEGIYNCGYSFKDVSLKLRNEKSWCSK